MGQASRISGVTPAAIMAIQVHLKGFRDAGIEEFRNAGIEEFRNAGIEGLRNAGIDESAGELTPCPTAS